MDADRVKIMGHTNGIWKRWKICVCQMVGKASWKIWNLRRQVMDK